MDAERWTRRSLLGKAAVAGATGTALGWLAGVRAARAQDGGDQGKPPASGLASGELVPLRYDSLPGLLSAKILALHHGKHYGGALRGLKGIEGRLYGAGGVGDAAARRELGRAQSAKANSVILHELYFAGMRPDAGDPLADLREALVARFGSLDRWREDMRACALAADGWAMLAVHPLNGRLYHVLSDAHDAGPIWLARPLLVIDMYEHAYYLDYTNDRASYVDAWLDRIDWDEASRRLQAAR